MNPSHLVRALDEAFNPLPLRTRIGGRAHIGLNTDPESPDGDAPRVIVLTRSPTARVLSGPVGAGRFGAVSVSLRLPATGTTRPAQDNGRPKEISVRHGHRMRYTALNRKALPRLAEASAESTLI